MKRWLVGVAVVAISGSGALVLAASAAPGGSGPATEAAATEGPPPPAAVPTLSPEESRVVAELNATRAEAGLEPVAVNAALSEKAGDWAGETADTGLRHSDLTDDLAGTICWRKLGENIAQGDTVAEIHQGWLDSPTHYANLTDPAFTEVGVSVVQDPTGTLFAVQEFMQEVPCTP